MVRYTYRALLDSEVSPLLLSHQMRLGDFLGHVLGQHDVTVLVGIVSVLIAVENLLRRHLAEMHLLDLAEINEIEL